jgi:transmembrane sensor
MLGFFSINGQTFGADHFRIFLRSDGVAPDLSSKIFRTINNRHKMEFDIAKNIIFHTFEGKATPMQQKMVEEWLAKTENTELYFKWLEEWEKETPQFLPDGEQAYQTFLSKTDMALDEGKLAAGKQIASRRGSIKTFWFRFAASIAIILGVGLWLSKEQILFKEYKTSFGEIKNITLPDESTVILNANSLLRVPRFGFGKSTREVFLQGEAEFSVTHTIDNQNFLVKTPDQLVVEVLGTEFLVYARQRGTKVALHKGKVQLHSLKEKQDKVLAMKAGEVVTVDKKGTFKLQVEENVEVYKAWQAHQFVFDHTSLQEIAYKIEENFGVKIQITDSLLAHRTITGTYQAQSVEELLQALEAILDVRVIKENGNITISEN